MRAAVVEQLGKPLVLRDMPVPELGPHDLLMKVEACGICYTDLRAIDALGGTALPLIPGHEPVGVVAATGSAVSGFQPGDRVGAHALFTCDDCAYCRAGEEEACVLGFTRLAGVALNGGYAEYLRLPAAHAIPLPATLSFTDAAPLFCAGLTTYAGLKNGNLQPGQRVAVIGIGGLGHLGIAIAKAMGATVYAVTGSAGKVDFAKQMGADFAGDVDTVAQQLRADGGAHLVLHTANALAPVARILLGMAKQGAIVLTAADGDTLPIPPNMFTALQLRVVGSFFGSRRDLRELLKLAEQHAIRPVTEVYPLSGVHTALDRLRAGDVRYRAVLTME